MSVWLHVSVAFIIAIKYHWFRASYYNFTLTVIHNAS